MLTQAGTISPDCDGGQSIHIGNLILGHIALSAGNIAEAKRRLLAAGKMPGVQHSFNANMSLAQELIEKNERGVVLEYLDLCAKSWNADPNNLQIWKTLVKKGGFPDFGGKGDSLIGYKIDAELLDIIRKYLKAGNLTKPSRSKRAKQ